MVSAWPCLYAALLLAYCCAPRRNTVVADVTNVARRQAHAGESPGCTCVYVCMIAQRSFMRERMHVESKFKYITMPANVAHIPMEKTKLRCEPPNPKGLPVRLPEPAQESAWTFGTRTIRCLPSSTPAFFLA
jgi:hypothetical protein